MPDEMVAWLQQLGDRLRLRFEVASVDRWVRRIARAIRNHQRVAVGQRPEGIPRRTPVAHASVDEDNTRPAADRLDVEVGHKRKINRLHRQGRHSLQAALQATPQEVNKVGRKWAVFVEKWPLSNVTSSAMLAVMEPSSPTFEPAGAGKLLSATTAGSVGVGALVGWGARSRCYGTPPGAALGLPARNVACHFPFPQ